MAGEEAAGAGASARIRLFRRKAAWCLGLAGGVPLLVWSYFLARGSRDWPLPGPNVAVVGAMMLAVVLLCGRLLSDLLESFLSLAREKAEVEASNLRLQETDRLKSDFLSSVSHELRTPLTSIRTFSEILLTYRNEEEATRERFLRIIHQESERLSNLINSVLDLAKIEAGRIVWNMAVCLLEDVLDRSVSVAQGLGTEKGIRVVLERPEALPAFYGDRERMQQVAMNLIGNAVKFSPEGGEVRVRAWRDPGERDRIRFSVSDGGPGIPAGQRARLFGRFEQLREPGAPKPPGTGLGLAISREVVEAHGGGIEVASEPGKGSVFTVTLPVWRPSSEFRAQLEFWIRQAGRRGLPLGVLVLGTEEGGDPNGATRALKATLQQCVRSSADAIAAYERPGFAAVLAFCRRVGLERIRDRLLDRIASGEAAPPGGAVAGIRSAIAEHPGDGSDAASLAAVLAGRLAGGLDPDRPAPAPAGAAREG